MSWVTGGAEQREAHVPRRRRRRQRSRVQETIGTVLLGTVLGGSALAFGAQQTPILVAAALAAGASAWLLRPSRFPHAVWFFVALGLYTLFQIVPLPLAWVSRLSPTSGAVWEGALRPFGEPPPPWITLSMDPAATALEALKWFSYGCVLVAASGLRERRGPVWPALLVASSGALVTVVTLFHGVVGLERVYGVYVAPTPSPWLRGPFVNGNNLAGYVNLAFFTGVGLLLSADRKLPAWPFLLSLPIMATQVLLSESRAGIACLALGALMVGLTEIRRRSGDSRRLVGGMAVAAGVLAVSAIVGGSRIMLALSDSDVHGKVSAWRWSLDLIRDYPLFGAGRGAFETAFQPYRRLLGGDTTMVFPYVENLALQWATDWGLIVAPLALGAAAFFAVRPFSKAFREPVTAGAAIGLVVLVVQNFADLGLEIFGVAALATVAFSVLGGGSPSQGRAGLIGLAASSAGAVVAAMIVVWMGAESVRFERRAVARSYAAWVRGGAREPQAFLKQLRAAVLRHPGEAYFPLVGSIVAAKAGGDPLPWIGRALERSPLDGHAHLRLADVLAPRARRQALLHLRLAAVYDSVLRDSALWKIVGLLKGPGDLVSTFPRGVQGETLLREACKRTSGAISIACWREVLTRDGQDMMAKRELAAGLLTTLEASTVPCQGETSRACKIELDRLMSEASRVPPDWQVEELRARQLALEGRFREAALHVLDYCPATHEAARCCERGVDYAKSAREVALLGTAADRYSAAVCGDPRACAIAHDRIGKGYQELGAFGAALRHHSAAAEQDPSADRWLELAEAAARAGSSVAARVAIDRAKREGRLSVDQQRRLEAARDLLNGGRSTN